MDMCNHELDPDIVRWGLHLLDLCSHSNAGSCCSVTQYAADSCPTEYVREEFCENCDPGYVNVENDEVIAHTLQEEFSRLASVEASGPSDAEKEHSQRSIITQDWFDPSGGHAESRGGEEDVAHETGISHSCSNPGEMSVSGEDCSYFLEIADELALDGEVGKRLDQMVPVPHVPKINGEIPSMDEATSDHQRLLDRLQLYDLVEFKVEGDGNCQFRALSDQIYRSPEHHKFVRQQVVKQLKSHAEMYTDYVPMAYGEYLDKISTSGEWGDHVTLQAAADSYGIKIFVLTSFKDTCYTEIVPHSERSKRVICLSFWAEVHYNSIYPAGDMPSFDREKKKKWWKF